MFAFGAGPVGSLAGSKESLLNKHTKVESGFGERVDAWRQASGLEVVVSGPHLYGNHGSKRQ